jgi:hypothetical protein
MRRDENDHLVVERRQSFEVFKIIIDRSIEFSGCFGLVFAPVTAPEIEKRRHDRYALGHDTRVTGFG